MVEPRLIRKVLITGITGAGGSYLAEHIVRHQPNAEVHGIRRWHSTATSENIRAISARIVLHECDLTDLSAVVSSLQTIRPDGIFHLASHANVRASFTTPLAVIQNNVMSTANLLEGVRLAGLEPYIQICSTSEVYGKVDPKDIPLKETAPFVPASPYAVSKATQDLLGQSYYLSYGMKIIRTRMFAYLNPRRADLFATAFARQVARIELGLQRELLHGNLDSVRTIIDVRDAMDAYWTALMRCAPGEAYNIGGKTVIRVGEFLEVLKKLAKCHVPSRVDPELLRPSDVTLQIPDTTKFERETGWCPQYAFEESVADLLQHCRDEVRKEAGSPKLAVLQPKLRVGTAPRALEV